jgi:hypothetical protein
MGEWFAFAVLPLHHFERATSACIVAVVKQEPLRATPGYHFTTFGLNYH